MNILSICLLSICIRTHHLRGSQPGVMKLLRAEGYCLQVTRMWSWCWEQASTECSALVISVSLITPSLEGPGSVAGETTERIKEPKGREVCSEMLPFRYVTANIAKNTQPLQIPALHWTIQLPITGEGESTRSQSFLSCSWLPRVPGGRVAIFSNGGVTSWEEECGSAARKGATRG